MNFDPTPDQQAFIRDAMARWEEIEQSRVELPAALDEAEGDHLQGRYRDYAVDALPILADELKREARKSCDSE